MRNFLIVRSLHDQVYCYKTNNDRILQVQEERHQINDEIIHSVFEIQRELRTSGYTQYHMFICKIMHQMGERISTNKKLSFSSKKCILHRKDNFLQLCQGISFDENKQHEKRIIHVKALKV